MPQPSPTQPVPAKLQTTVWFPLPVTVAVNCCCWLTATWALGGVMVIVAPDATVTVAVAYFVWSATEVACTVTVAGFGATGGAMYNPELEMKPQVGPEQPDPYTDQSTPVFDVPVTVAVNCC